MDYNQAFELIDGNTVMQILPRHRKPSSDDAVLSVFHRTTAGGRSVLLSRPEMVRLRDWANAWLAEGWDGVQRRCGVINRTDRLHEWACTSEPGHGGLHSGLSIAWPAGEDKTRKQWT